MKLEFLGNILTITRQYVILVGGFGRNKYMHKYLKTRMCGVEVLQSQGAEP